MCKKITLMVMVLVLVSLGISCSDSDFKTFKNVEYKYADYSPYLHYEVNSFKGDSPFVDIPSHIKGIPVILVNENFGKNYSVETINMPFIQTVDIEAFMSCVNLSFINIPKVEIIKYGAFFNCNSLEMIYLPQTLKHLDSSAFNSCEKLSSVYFEGDPEYIGDNAFDKGVTIFGNRGGNVEKYALKNGLKFIGASECLKEIFSENYFNKSVEFNINELAINGNVLKGILGIKKWNQLGSLVIPSNVDIILDGAFEKEAPLGSIHLNDVKEIYPYAFRQIWVLRIIYFSNVERIGREAFRSCSQLETVLFTPSVTYIESGAFADCSDLKEMYFMGDPIIEGMITDIDVVVYGNSGGNVEKYCTQNALQFIGI